MPRRKRPRRKRTAPPIRRPNKEKKEQRRNAAGGAKRTQVENRKRRPKANAGEQNAAVVVLKTNTGNRPPPNEKLAKRASGAEQLNCEGHLDCATRLHSAFRSRGASVAALGPVLLHATIFMLHGNPISNPVCAHASARHHHRSDRLASATSNPHRTSNPRTSNPRHTSPPHQRIAGPPHAPTSSSGSPCHPWCGHFTVVASCRL